MIESSEKRNGGRVTLDAVIIGAGPAGIATAIYLKRAGLDICILEKKRVGGLLHNAHLVENYPGFHGVKGKELAGHMQGQLRKWGIEVHHETALVITKERGGFRVATIKGKWHSRAVLVATGTVPKKLDVEGALDLEGVHLFYEVADLPESVSGKEVAIIGSGDAAFDYALNLANEGATVRILHRDKESKCLPLLWERMMINPSIHVFPDWAPSCVEEHNARIMIRSHVDEVEADYLLVAIGRDPDDGLIRGFKERPHGLYMAGDVQQGLCRQVGIAVGDGIRAAMTIADYLEDLRQNEFMKEENE